MNKFILRILLILSIIFLIIGFYYFELGAYLSLDYIKSQREAYLAFSRDNFAVAALVYVGIYVAVAALSLPGAAIMTLLGGAVFGVYAGVVLVSFASTIGATLAFLASRFLFRNAIQNKFQDKLVAINNGIEKEGLLYLFTLRLVPLFPFFVVNLVMGLTRLSTISFFFVSQIGMFPGTFVYVNAGTQLANINSPADILSFPVIISFALLGIFPLIAKRIINLIKRRQALGKYKKPKSFDYNVIAIGAGAAGLVTSYIGSAVKAKVAMIEKGKYGGDCLNYGCVPSKTILKSAKIAKEIKQANKYGLSVDNLQVDFSQVMNRVKNAISEIEPHDSPARYSKLGVDCYEGHATIRSPYEVEINGNILTTRNIVIATGGAPFIPPIPGIDKVDPLTSDTLWEIPELPKRLLIMGGGPIGCELSQAFSRLGSSVTQVEREERILIREDKEVADFLSSELAVDGVKTLLSHNVVSFAVENNEKVAVCQYKGKEVKIPFDQVIVAVGRRPRTEGFGAQELGIKKTERGTFEVNEYLQTSIPNIYACGDVAGPYQFTHVAAYQAWFCAVNSLFGAFRKFKVDYRVIPWVTFTDPEVARVGLSETDAKAKGIEYEVAKYDLAELDRAIAEGDNKGSIKVLTRVGSDHILGATIVGPHAGEYLTELVTAMKYNLGLKKILGTIHAYPTYAEANKYVAGEWQKAHKPEKVLKLLQKFHAWMRG